MPTIEITEPDFKRMQLLAEPLVDTPASLFTKMLDVFEKHGKNLVSSLASSNRETKVYSFDAPPPLVHVKVISGLIGTSTPRKANWDSMVALCLELVLEQNVSPERAGTLIDLNIKRGRKVDEGYKYLEDSNVSYQGVSAKHAALIIGKTARFLRSGAHVDFIWREREDAFAPGKVGALSYDLS